MLSPCSYSPGDVIMVHPNNLNETLSIAYEALNIDDDLLNRPITLRSRETCISLPPSYLYKGKNFYLFFFFITSNKYLLTVIEIKFFFVRANVTNITILIFFLN